MKLLKVDPRQVKIPEIRVTAQFDDETNLHFKESVKEIGIEDPIICYKIGEELWLSDGKHRLDEAIDNGFPSVDVIVREGDMVKVMCRNIMAGHLRGKHPVSEMVKVIGSLYSDHQADIEKIAKETGLSQDYIEKLIRISQASPEVLEALDKQAIGVGVAFELSRLPARLIQEEILAKSTVYRLNVKDVKELVDDVLHELKVIADKPADKAPASEPRVLEYHCEGCKTIVEQKYLRMVGICPDCFGEIWRLAKARATILEEEVEETPIP